MTGSKKKVRDVWHDKAYNTLNKLSVKCKCGHNITICNSKGYRVCIWCKHLVFVNKQIEERYRKDEFKKRLRRKINE